uniref:PSI domain-containing protein n=1 Tax=Macrostomum lignano TaxID=282301 RepID=A0A1I8I0Y3_9PLAT
TPNYNLLKSKFYSQSNMSSITAVYHLLLWLALLLPQLPETLAGVTDEDNSSKETPPVYCAWLSWTSCEGCQQPASRSRRCHCESVEFHPPHESRQCGADERQSEDCSETYANSSCFYTWPSTSIVMLGLGLLLLTAVLLACARLRQYYGRFVCCCSGSRDARRTAGRTDGGVGSRRRTAGPDADFRDPAFDFPPPFHVAVADWPPAYTVEPPPQPIAACTSSAEDFPPPYEESAARFKLEIRFATQR